MYYNNGGYDPTDIYDELRSLAEPPISYLYFSWCWSCDKRKRIALTSTNNALTRTEITCKPCDVRWMTEDNHSRPRNGMQQALLEHVGMQGLYSQEVPRPKPAVTRQPIQEVKTIEW